MAFSVSYVYQVIDRFTAPLNKIFNSSNRFTQTMKKSSQTIDKFSGKMTSFQGVASGVATAIGGKVALDKFVGFEDSMNKLEAVTFATGDQMSKMRDMAKTLGAQTQFSASEAAQGMTYLAMAGLDTDQVLKAIPGALQLAAAGSLDLGQAADIATNVLGQMGMSVEELSHVNDVLALAQSKANFNIVELFEAMRPVGTTAKNLGISLEELTANLGAMANAGEKGSIAGTLLRNALTNISGASESQKKLYKELGINLSEFVDQAGKIKNFKGLVGELQKLQSQGKLSVEVLQDLYGDRGFRAMQILAQTGADAIGKLEEKLKDSEGAAAKAAEIMMKGLPGALKSLTSAVEAVTIAFFESGLDKTIYDISQAIIQAVRSISQFNPAILKVLGIIGLAVTVITPFLVVLGVIAPVISGIVTVFGFLGTAVSVVIGLFSTLGAAIGGAVGVISLPFLAIVAAIAGVGAAIYQVWKNWDYLVQDFKAGISFLIEKAGILAEKMAAISPLNVGKKIGKWLGFGKEKEGIAAENTRASTANLNGSIVVSSAPGTSVDQVDMKTSVPGNLGMNIAGAF